MIQAAVQTEAYFGLEEKIKTRTATFGVIGLGHVGLPLGLALSDAGFRVTGVDIDSNRVHAIASGRSYITDIEDPDLQKATRANRFHATSDLNRPGELDAISICVPTPFRKTKDPDMSYVISAANSIAKELRLGQLIIVESATRPGATEELILPIFEARGLKVGEDFFLAYSPERVDPGNKQFSTRDIPKVVGGVTPRCGALTAALYGAAMKHIVMVSSTRVAEMANLLENTFRSVNIALANEIALMCAHMKIDCWEVIKAASSKPFGFMPFYPGPGLGGHYSPIDPLYLEWQSKTGEFKPRFIGLADKINRGMPRYVVTRVMELMNERGKAIRGSRIHILGVTYKRDISDSRESPAMEIIKLLLGLGAAVTYSDPFARAINVDGQKLERAEPSREHLSACDLAIIITDHSTFDYPQIVRDAPIVFDMRNATDGLQSRNLVRL